jgi:hypothetical protein
MGYGVSEVPSTREKAFAMEKRPCRTPRTPHPGPRRGIVLLMTLFFIIAITVIVGVSLSQFRGAQTQLQQGQMLVQSAVTLEDVLEIIKKSGFGDVNDTASLDLFLSMSSVIPLETESLRGLVTIKSTGGRININTLGGSKPFQDALVAYLSGPLYQVQDPDYLVDLLIDCMGGEKEVYLTELFSEMPWLYRDRIVNESHLQQLLDYYARNRHDGSVYTVPWKELVRFGDRGDDTLNANYMTPQVWMLLQPALLPEQIEALSDGTVLYESQEDFGLPAETLEDLINDFKIVYFTPRVEVTLLLETEEEYKTSIVFEYDMKTKQARKFDYAI